MQESELEGLTRGSRNARIRTGGTKNYQRKGVSRSERLPRKPTKTL